MVKQRFKRFSALIIAWAAPNAPDRKKIRFMGWLVRWWGRYLERLRKATGGGPPCSH